MTSETQPTRSPLDRRLVLLGVVVLIVVVALVYFFVLPRSTGVAKPPTRADQQQAADDALAILRDLAKDNYQLLGFSSPDEAQTATLSTPLTVFFVPLDQLRAYSPDDDPNTLLSDSQMVFYPVKIGEEVRSSVQIQASAEGWTPAGFGSASLLKAVAAAKPSADAFIVQVPAMGFYFVAQRQEEGLMLTPVQDLSQFDLALGQPVEASQLFGRIQAAAKELQDDAPM